MIHDHPSSAPGLCQACATKQPRCNGASTGSLVTGVEIMQGVGGWVFGIEHGAYGTLQLTSAGHRLGPCSGRFASG